LIGREKLHTAEGKVFKTAGKFGRAVRSGRWQDASAIALGLGITFSSLAHAREMKIPAVRTEFEAVADKLDMLQHAVATKATDLALATYQEIILSIPPAHIKIAEAVDATSGAVQQAAVHILLDGRVGDLGSRGGPTEDLNNAALRAVAMLGLG
jgi:hypothetical protein